MTAIVDYRAGNLTSVRLAFNALGAETVISSDPSVIRAAERVVFPGVGAAASAMATEMMAMAGVGRRWDVFLDDMASFPL